MTSGWLTLQLANWSQRNVSSSETGEVDNGMDKSGQWLVYRRQEETSSG